MSRYLLDTSVLATLLRRRPDERLLECLRAVSPRDVATAAVCLFELRGASARHPRSAEVWRQIGEELLPRIPVLPFGEAEAVRAGDLIAGLIEKGESAGIEEVQIAATAIEHGLFLATRAPRRFGKFPGLSVVSWCE